METVLNGSASTGQAEAPQSTGNPAPAGLMDSKPSTSNTSWKETLPDDLKSNPAIGNFQDVPSLVKSYIHAQSLVGKKGAIVPTDKSSPEEWEYFYKSIGRPEMDKYEFQAPKELSPEKMAKMKEIAYKAGMLPKQAQAVAEWMAAEDTSSKNAQTQKMQSDLTEGVNALKREWGEGFDRQISVARLAAKELGGDEYIAHLEKTGLGNDIPTIKALAKAGKLLAEDKMRGATASGNGNPTPDELADEYSSMSSRMLSMQNGPERDAIKRKVEILAQRRWG